MNNGRGRKVNWRWAAAAVMVALLAACAAPARQSAAPAAPAATARAPAAAEEPQSSQTPADRVPLTPTAAAGGAPVTTPALEPRETALAAPSTTQPAQPAANDAITTTQPAPESAVSAVITATSAMTSPYSSAPAPAPAPMATTAVIPTPLVTSEGETSRAEPTVVVPSATSNPTAAPTATPDAAAVSMEALTATKVLTAGADAMTAPQVITSETRIVELEWPPEMKLGNTDIVRVALIPSEAGYIMQTQLPGNTTVTQTVEVNRPEHYDVFAVGQLDGAGFDIEPKAEWSKTLVPGKTVDWRWTIDPRAAGQHRLAVVIKLRWVPSDDLAEKIHEADLFSTSLTVQVASVMGMSTAQASSTGLVGLLIGSSLGLLGLAFRRAPQIRATLAQVVNPNASLKIEPHAAMQLADDEIALLRALFAKYDRVVIENEFRSGYSGARTFLVHPIHADGRADAFTIAKMGNRASIQREFDNYQRFVKDTLPPITARIQEPPVTAPALFNRDDKAVLRYTFIGEQGRMPVSLREALLAEQASPDRVLGASLINKLFETFGPNWWMQRKPYVFRLAQEYDRLLPAHFVIEPVAASAVSGAKRMDGRRPAEQDTYRVGDVVVLEHFPAAGIELRADGRSLSLRGEAAVGQPALRVRWMRADVSQTRRFANGIFGRIVGTRETLLRELVAGPRGVGGPDGGADLHGLPDPIGRLPSLLNERVQGTQSTIHGDLNLENGLVGPGGFVWLIDFAETRDGHALYDFAHLEAEIIAHVIAPAEADSATFVDTLRAGGYPLLESVHGIAAKCLFNPSHSHMREYWLVLGVTCLGATKHSNLTVHQQHLLFLTAAYLFEKL